jgi:KDO2-lipid IV(A) lauroyltransferase
MGMLFVPFVRTCEVLANALPRRVGLEVFAALGDVACLIDRRARRRTLSHLEIAYGDRLSVSERREVRRRMFQDFARNLVDFLRLPRTSKSELRQLVQFEGLEHLDEALAKGRGVLAVSAHFGSWELLGAALVARGYEVHVLAREVFDPRVGQRLQALRQHAGITVHVGQGGLVGIVRALKRGKIVGVLLDQDTGGPAVFTDFFGRLARTPTTPFSIARRMEAEIVPMLIHLDGLAHRVRIHRPLANSGTSPEAIGMDLRAWHRILEREITACPSQWVWFHQRWKRRPEAAVEAPFLAPTPSNEMLITR